MNPSIERKRERLAKMRPAYEKAVQSLAVEDMLEILAKLTEIVFRHRPDSPPQSACFLIGRAQERLTDWYASHTTILAFEQLKKELTEAELKELRDG